MIKTQCKCALKKTHTINLKCDFNPIFLIKCVKKHTHDLQYLQVMLQNVHFRFEVCYKCPFDTIKHTSFSQGVKFQSDLFNSQSSI